MEVPLPPAPTSDLTARDRHRLSRALMLTPSERLAAMRAILASSWALEPVQAVIDTGILVDGIRFASLEWLRKLKAAAGTAKDLLDLENLPQPERP